MRRIAIAREDATQFSELVVAVSFEEPWNDA